MIRRPPRSTQSRSSAASDVYKRQGAGQSSGFVSHHSCGRNQREIIHNPLHSSSVGGVWLQGWRLYLSGPGNVGGTADGERSGYGGRGLLLTRGTREVCSR